MSSQVPHVYDIVLEKGLPARMRDGTVLRSDVYRPDSPGRFPVLVRRSPYGMDRPRDREYGEWFARRGYVVVAQDGRSRFSSDGSDPYYPLIYDAHDGYDTIEWAARLPWSNGRVGALGQSYSGAAQMQLVAERPPHLRAAFPVSSPSAWHESWVYRTGGALEWGWLVSYALLTIPEELRRQGREDEWPAFARYLKDPASGPMGELSDDAYSHLPLSDWVERLGSVAPYLSDYFANADDGAYWRRLNLTDRWRDVGVPLFHLTSWYDGFQEGALNAFTGIREFADESTARGQKLFIGPWSHLYTYADPTTGDTGDLDFGPDSAIYLHDLELRWFDYWLKGIRNGIVEEPPVTLFVMGDNVWRDENEWPLARTKYTSWYLHSKGAANSAAGDGTLSREHPGDEAPDEYVYDPRDPVPSRGGNACLEPALAPRVVGAFDQRSVRERRDILVYTSEVLQSDLEVTGPLSVELFASSSADDTDFTAKLVDVRPNGYALNIQQGIMRARYRISRSSPEPLTPGEPTRFLIDLWATSHVFKAGHRISVEISSSNFPLFDRHPNRYMPLHEAQLEDLQPAKQTVFHDTSRPSRIILPVIPR